MITVFLFKSHPVQTTPVVAAKRKRKSPHPTEKLPLVRFDYPKSGDPSWAHPQERQVRLIGANAKYYVGVEVNCEKPGYKKFLRRKASQFTVLEFSPESIS